MTDERVRGSGGHLTVYQPALVLAGFLFVALIFLFWDGLVELERKWGASEEYSYGYLIPVVAFYLLWLRAKQFKDLQISGAWAGVPIVVAGIFAFVLGELSSIYFIIQYGFLITTVGLVVAAAGWKGLKIAWVPIAYLVFMVPLPEFLFTKLSTQLQLISSDLGVAVIRWFGVSVYLEGNVIDLGIYQLQVAEACNGLRYLFPLMSFGFLCAAVYQGPTWHKVVVFLSSIPITVLMNSFRIGVIGVLVDNYGIEQAEGFLHYFEGWIVFMACVGLMFLIMWGLHRLSGSGKSLLQVFGLDVPPVDDLGWLLPGRITWSVAVVSLLMIGGLVVGNNLEHRVDLIPERQKLASFPLKIGDWSGQDSFVDQIYLDALQVDDYLSAQYSVTPGAPPVDLWIAYYSSQRKGQSTHSPRTCLPGGGWAIESLTQETIANVGAGGGNLEINRVLIAKGDVRQLVYYWFVERGETMTNEYLVKWQIFWDSLTKNRTDGALVRLVTYVREESEIPAADERLHEFVRAIDPKLSFYLPRQETTFVNTPSVAWAN